MDQLNQYIKVLVLFTIISLNRNSLCAQQGGGIFYHLTAANGLSSNRVNAIIQDKEGFYWIATNDGLNRFDGSSCKIFRNSKDDSASLSHNHCIDLLEDDNGDIWIATLFGVNRYKKKEGKFERIYLHHPSLPFERVNWIRKLEKDKAGNIWIASDGLWQYNIHTNAVTPYLSGSGDTSTIPAGTVYSIVNDNDNNGLWLSVGNGFAFFDIGKNKFYHKDFNPGKILLFTTPGDNTPLVADRQQRLWFCDKRSNTLQAYNKTLNRFEKTSMPVDKGIKNLSVDNKGRIWIHFWVGKTNIYDPATGMIDSAFLQYYHAGSAVSQVTSNLYIDRSGDYWIASLDGISIYNPNAQSAGYYLLDDDHKTSEGGELAITCIAEQNDSLLWIGTSAGLFLYNQLSRSHKFIGKIPVDQRAIKSLYLHNNRLLWVGGYNGLLLYDIKTGKVTALSLSNTKNIVWSITPGSGGKIYVVTWSDGLYVYSSDGKLLEHLLPADSINNSIKTKLLVCLALDTLKSYAWVGYNGGNGFSRFNLKDNTFEHFNIHVKNSLGKGFNTVNCIKEDKKGNLWIGTFGGGLFYFIRDENAYYQFTQSDGLKSDFINEIVEDEKERLWISTSNGISVLDSAGKIITFSGLDIYPSGDDLVHNALVRKNKNFLFFAGKRFADVSPLSFLQNPVPSVILINFFKVFDKDVSLVSESNGIAPIHLSYKDNFFSFGYSLLKPDPNSTTQYAYLLEGFDKDWNNVNERRIADYTNVPPGKYFFRIKAADQVGRWIYQSRPLEIIISPPFWRTWWFIIIIAGVIAGSLSVFYRYRINQLKKILAIRTKISRDLHDEVGATLSSIHIYSSVAAKTLDKDTAKTKDALQQINENTRQVMENMSDIVWAINADNAGETTLAAKLKNYGYDLLTPLNINCIYEIEKEAESKLVNMEARKNILLIAKEAINNIARHSRATQTSIKLKIHGKNLELEITDNGHGLSAEHNHTGHGMMNMKQRTEIMGGVFRVNADKNGTKISCSIPVANISD